MVRAFIPLIMMCLHGLATAADTDFTSMGANTACRLNTADTCTASDCSHHEGTTGTATKERCMALCRSWSGCKGIEVRQYSTGWSCEIWKETIGHSKNVNAFTCYTYTPSLSNTASILNTLKLTASMQYVDYASLSSSGTTLLATAFKNYMLNQNLFPSGTKTDEITMELVNSPPESTKATLVVPFDVAKVSWTKMHYNFRPSQYTTLGPALRTAATSALTGHTVSGKTFSDVVFTLGPTTDVIYLPSTGSSVAAAEGRGPGVVPLAGLLLWATVSAALL